MKVIERRGKTRIEINYPIQFKNQHFQCDGELLDISLSGARLSLPVEAKEHISQGSIVIKSDQQVELSIKVKVVHLLKSEPRLIAGFEFELRDKALQKRLYQLIRDFLQKPGGGHRKHPRLAKRIELNLHDPDALEAVLENISMGGLSITTTEAYDLEQKIDVAVPLTGNALDECLEVQGVIVYKEEVFQGDTAYFRLGLKFAKLSQEKEDTIARIIEHLATDGDIPDLPLDS